MAQNSTLKRPRKFQTGVNQMDSIIHAQGGPVGRVVPDEDTVTCFASEYRPPTNGELEHNQTHALLGTHAILVKSEHYNEVKGTVQLELDGGGCGKAAEIVGNEIRRRFKGGILSLAAERDEAPKKNVLLQGGVLEGVRQRP